MTYLKTTVMTVICCEKYDIVITNAIVTSHIAKDKVSVLVSHTSSNFSFGLQLITWNFSTSWQKNCQIEIKKTVTQYRSFLPIATCAVSTAWFMVRAHM